MTKKERKTVRVAAGDVLASAEAKKERKLTLREEKFIEHYIRTGNAASSALEAGYAHNSCRQEGYRLLTLHYIKAAIDEERARLKDYLKFDRETYFQMLVGMAFATQDDFAEVLKDPTNPEAYANLGMKRHALKSAKKSYKNGNEVTLVDKQAAMDKLYDRLGLGEKSDPRDWSDGLGRIAEIVAGLGGKRKG